MNVAVFDSDFEVDESLIEESSATIREQVAEYERGDRRAFGLTVDTPSGLVGEVMTEMLAIPYGETRTYGEIATRLDTAPVAVGRACGCNPVPLIVPCHRVVASDGSLRGYSGGDGVATKRRLLGLEARESGATVQARLPTQG
jgi:methylated-DNA-[protein]-cysteine S-methyltransferase